VLEGWREAFMTDLSPCLRCGKDFRRESRSKAERSAKGQPGEVTRDARARYGLSLADYQGMKAAQGGGCWGDRLRSCASPPQLQHGSRACCRRLCAAQGCCRLSGTPRGALWRGSRETVLDEAGRKHRSPGGGLIYSPNGDTAFTVPRPSCFVEARQRALCRRYDAGRAHS
jgi:hypothetical protein